MKSWLDLNINNLLITLKNNISIHLCQIYIFGSAIKKPNPNDIDLMIIFKENITDEEKLTLRSELRKLNDIAIESRPFHLLILHSEEFNNPLNQSPALSNIEKTSIKLDI